MTTPYYVFKDKSGRAMRQFVNEAGKWETEPFHPTAKRPSISQVAARPVSDRTRAAAWAMVEFCGAHLGIPATYWPTLAFERATGKRMGAFSLVNNQITIADNLPERDVLETVAHECFHAAVFHRGHQNKSVNARWAEEVDAEKYAQSVVANIEVIHGLDETAVIRWRQR